MVFKEDIMQGLKQLGVRKGDILLVHSSLSSFGTVSGGVATLIEALLESVTEEEGTIIVPTLTGKETDSKLNPPVFDCRYTPCWTGKVPETFRLMPGAKRSLHPTHSVAAIGAKRDELVLGHETGESPCDTKSPYYKNAVLGGYILLIGVDQESNTTVHCCEELAGVPYHLQKEICEIAITGYEGENILVRNRLHDWSKPPTDFNRFDDIYLQAGIMRKTKIGNSTIRLVNAKDMLELSVGILKSDPLFLVIDH